MLFGAEEWRLQSTSIPKPIRQGGNMEKRPKKLELSKETLRNLDDQELSGIVGGTGTIVCVNTVLCHSGLCESAVCESVICL